ncbi:putative HIT-like protein [Fundidesulfovibrio magnetotacticus]|uniref:Putative HIT-like protein n=1 Tax=Fundidesulfovibrio magnetotacticus TaxID=2730080 RepID=A0A6V8LZX7_9BACT|nr:HIT family protein [Fundidesulfovibrio magnetotacticus]GFK95336.1 putative HIT-like protein [Fundidesulfovibrio magnetotacticus]
MSHQDCIFCKIVKGEIPCSKVYETGAVLAFLDIAPVNKGHVLLIPKEHFEDVWALPPALAPELLDAIQRVGLGLKQGLGALGMNLGMNNGRAAGQLVFHAHWHLIPRFEGDGLTLWPQQGYADTEEMNTTARAIADHIRT